MPRATLLAVVTTSALAALLGATPASHAREQFEVVPVQNSDARDNRAGRQLGAHSGGRLGTFGNGSLGASVDHGIGVLRDSGTGTYRGGGLGALGDSQDSVAPPLRPVPGSDARVGEQHDAGR